MGCCSSVPTLLGWAESQLYSWSLAWLFPGPVSHEEPWKGLCPCKDNSKLKTGIQCLSSGSSLASASKQSQVAHSVSDTWKKARIRATAGPRHATSMEKAVSIACSSTVLTAGLLSFQNHNQDWVGLKWKCSQTAASHQQNPCLSTFHCCFQEIHTSPISFQIPQEGLSTIEWGGHGLSKIAELRGVKHMTKRKSESLCLGLDPIPWQSLGWSLCGRSPDEATEHSVKGRSCSACPVLLQKHCKVSEPRDITRVGKSRSQAASETKFHTIP